MDTPGNMFNRIKAKTTWPSTARSAPDVAGDLGAKREAEMSKAFPNNVKAKGSFPSNPLQMNKPRLMNKNSDQIVGSIKSGPDTIGGAVGGKKDKGDYSGVKAGKR